MVSGQRWGLPGIAVRARHSHLSHALQIMANCLGAAFDSTVQLGMNRHLLESWALEREHHLTASRGRLAKINGVQAFAS